MLPQGLLGPRDQATLDDGSAALTSSGGGGAGALPLVLAVVSGAGTFFGGCALLAMLPSPPASATLPPRSAYLFGRLQASSAGIMLALSLNLLVEAVPNTGLLDATVWLAGGAVVMYLIERFIPDAHSGHSHNHESNRWIPLPIHSDSPVSAAASVPSGAAVTSPAAAENASGKPMESHRDAGCFAAATSLFGDPDSGPMAAIMARTGIVTYIGLAIHNLPAHVWIGRGASSASNIVPSAGTAPFQPSIQIRVGEMDRSGTGSKRWIQARVVAWAALGILVGLIAMWLADQILVSVVGRAGYDIK
ncbi:hypothetical protein HK405_012545 [Cladochytrium tenue]|nr:hypothetical protein HK405_012545 [Cladochytrium tenue]